MARVFATASSASEKEELLILLCQELKKPFHEGKRDSGLKGKARCSITSLANFCIVNGLTMRINGAEDLVEIFYKKMEPIETSTLPEEFHGDPEEDDPPF